jgi:hypothetical protein
VGCFASPSVIGPGVGRGADHCRFGHGLDRCADRSVGMQIQIISTAGHAEAPAARLGPPIRAVAGIEPAEPSASQRRQGPQRDRSAVLSLLGVPVKTCHQPQTSTSWGFRRQVADDVVALLGTNEGPGGISRDLPAGHLSCQTGRFVTDSHSSAVVRHALSAVLASFIAGWIG